MPAFQCLCISKMRESIFEFFCPSFLERKEGESGGEKPLSRLASREIPYRRSQTAKFLL